MELLVKAGADPNMQVYNIMYVSTIIDLGLVKFIKCIGLQLVGGEERCLLVLLPWNLEVTFNSAIAHAW